MYDAENSLMDMRMFRPEQPAETPETGTSFENLDLLGIPLEEIDQSRQDALGITYARDPGDRLFFGETALEFQGGRFPLRVVKTLDLEGYQTMDFRIGTEGAQVDADVHLNRRDTEYAAVAFLLKTDPDEVLPRGIGMRLYAKALDALQAFADKNGLPVVHEVHRDVRLSPTPMSEERWDQLFGELLASRGYAQSTPGEWVLTYRPH